MKCLDDSQPKFFILRENFGFLSRFGTKTHFKIQFPTERKFHHPARSKGLEIRKMFLREGRVCPEGGFPGEVQGAPLCLGCLKVAWTRWQGTTPCSWWEGGETEIETGGQDPGVILTLNELLHHAVEFIMTVKNCTGLGVTSPAGESWGWRGGYRQWGSPWAFCLPPRAGSQLDVPMFPP